MLKGCLAAKNRFKRKMSQTKYSISLSKMAAVTKDELMKASKNSEGPDEENIKTVNSSRKVIFS